MFLSGVWKVTWFSQILGRVVLSVPLKFSLGWTINSFRVGRVITWAVGVQTRLVTPVVSGTGGTGRSTTGTPVGEEGRSKTGWERVPYNDPLPSLPVSSLVAVRVETGSDAVPPGTPGS